MSLQINRFEKKDIKIKTKGQSIPISFKKETGVLIKDHTTEEFISYIQLNDNYDENNELADRIITTIEEYIMEKENE